MVLYLGNVLQVHYHVTSSKKRWHTVYNVTCNNSLMFKQLQEREEFGNNTE